MDRFEDAEEMELQKMIEAEEREKNRERDAALREEAKDKLDNRYSVDEPVWDLNNQAKSFRKRLREDHKIIQGL